MIKKKTSVDIWQEFVNDNGREPTREEFINMGYNANYYYEVKKKFQKLKAAQSIQSVKVENETLIFS